MQSRKIAMKVKAVKLLPQNTYLIEGTAIKLCGTKVEAVEEGEAEIYCAKGAKKELYAAVTVWKGEEDYLLPPKWGIYIADPEAHVIDGKIYVFGSLDGKEGVFCSEKYIFISSEDMETWETEGVSFEMTEANSAGTKVMWAPDACKYEDKYYVYGWYMATRDKENMFVLKSDDPMKGYGGMKWITYEDGEKVVGGDPAVYVEGGERYLLHGSCEMADPQIGRLIGDEVMERGSVKNLKEYLPDFFEGVSLRKIDGRYYLLYAENMGPVTKENRTPKKLSYAVSDELFGPYKYMGTIVSNEEREGAINIHGSIEKFKDKIYAFYHTPYKGVWNHRSVQAREIEIEKDGKIKLK